MTRRTLLGFLAALIPGASRRAPETPDPAPDWLPRVEAALGRLDDGTPGRRARIATCRRLVRAHAPLLAPPHLDPEDGPRVHASYLPGAGIDTPGLDSVYVGFPESAYVYVGVRIMIATAPLGDPV